MRGFAVYLWVPILLGLLMGVGYAQLPHFRVEELMGDFVPKEWVMDEEGFIWMGEKEVIYRYDGLSWEAFEGPVKDSKVSSMQRLKNGEIWLGYENGQICFLRENVFSLFEPEEGLPGLAITAIAVDRLGNLWFATYGEGLYYHNGRHLYQRSTEDGLSDDDIYALIADSSGNLFAGSDGGLMQLFWENDQLQIKLINEKDGLPDLIVRELALGKNGQIWLGMYEGGVAEYYPARDSLSLLASPAGQRTGAVNQLLALENQLLIGTDRKGLWAWEQGNWRPWLQDRRESIHALLSDGRGQIWVSSSSHGFLSASYRFEKIQAVQAHIQTVYEARDGMLYFAAKDGFFSRNSAGKIDSLIYPTSAAIISISEKNTGELLLGTFGEGIIQFDPQSRQRRFFTEAEGLINNNVLAFAQKGNAHWVATLGGVSRCEWQTDGRPTFTNFDQKDGLGTNYIYHVFVDSKGLIWFGTDGRGAYVFDGQLIKRIAGLEEFSIYSIAEDQQGVMWFATKDKGVLRMQGDSLLASSPSLSQRQAAGLLLDAQMRMLISHPHGIDIIEPAHNQSLSFGGEAGLEGLEADLNVLARGQQGYIWVGSPQGLFRYQAGIPLASRVQTRLTGVYLFQEKLTENPLSLAYDQNNLRFDFTGLWYLKADALRYRYRLLGLSKEWQQTADRSVTFPKLAPGKYLFEVEAIADGGGESQAVSYAFRIHYPIWQKWWFVLLALAAAAYLLFLLWRYRERQLRKRELLEQEKIRFQFETLRSQVNPHFLFNSFNTLINLIDEEPQVAIRYVEKLSDLFRNMLAFRDKDSISLKEELEILQDYYFLQKKRYGGKLDLQIDIDASLMQLHIVPLSLQMLVENAVKHNVISQAKNLQIHIRSEGEYVCIENPVQLKRTAVPSTKLGLQNIRRRYALLTEREVEILSDEDRFMVKIPLLHSST